MHIFSLIFPEQVGLFPNIFPEQGQNFLGRHLPVHMSTVTGPPPLEDKIQVASVQMESSYCVQLGENEYKTADLGISNILLLEIYLNFMIL